MSWRSKRHHLRQPFLSQDKSDVANILSWHRRHVMWGSEKTCLLKTLTTELIITMVWQDTRDKSLQLHFCSTNSQNFCHHDDFPCFPGDLHFVKEHCLTDGNIEALTKGEYLSTKLLDFSLHQVHAVLNAHDKDGHLMCCANIMVEGFLWCHKKGPGLPQQTNWLQICFHFPSHLSIPFFVSVHIDTEVQPVVVKSNNHDLLCHSCCHGLSLSQESNTGKMVVKIWNFFNDFDWCDAIAFHESSGSKTWRGNIFNCVKWTSWHMTLNCTMQ